MFNHFPDIHFIIMRAGLYQPEFFFTIGLRLFFFFSYGLFWFNRCRFSMGWCNDMLCNNLSGDRLYTKPRVRIEENNILHGFAMTEIIFRRLRPAKKLIDLVSEIKIAAWIVIIIKTGRWLIRLARTRLAGFAF